MGLTDKQVETYPPPDFVAKVCALHFSGQLTASKTAIAQFTCQEDWHVTRVEACRQLSGGTISAHTVDVSDDGTSILTAALDVDTAGDETVVGEDFSTAVKIAAGSEITVDIVLTGSSPTADNQTVVIHYRTKVGAE